jgi:hypothetical protein
MYSLSIYTNRDSSSTPGACAINIHRCRPTGYLHLSKQSPGKKQAGTTSSALALHLSLAVAAAHTRTGQTWLRDAAAAAAAPLSPSCCSWRRWPGARRRSFPRATTPAPAPACTRPSGPWCSPPLPRRSAWAPPSFASSSTTASSKCVPTCFYLVL